MPFQPQVWEELEIDGTVYRVAEHPNAPGMPFGQEGRQAIVYQLAAEDERRALKVFKPRFSTPSLVLLADQIARLASLPGLQVCQRTVLTARRHTPLLRRFPDLTYAVLMPWVEGPTWQEIVLERKALTSDESLGIARALAEVLVTMEERGIAHCDLSGPNLILSPDFAQAAVALVDVEGIYAPGLSQPDVLPAGSPGYAHRTAPRGQWGQGADRFAGAVLLAEVLGWSDPVVREAAWGENYFHAQEMQKEGERYATLVGVLRSTWGDNLANLLTAAWHSDTLADCPTLGKWLVALPEQAPARPEEQVAAATPEPTISVALLVLNAQTAADAGSWDQALELYRQAMEAAPPELADEITARIAAVEARRRAVTEERPKPPPAPLPEVREVVTPRWHCPHCGRAVGEELEVCPHCERGRRDGTVVRAEPPPTWRCANCGRHAPAAMDLCPHCERGQRDGTVLAARRPEVPEASVAARPPITFWKCPSCGRVVPPARDLCPHCLRGRRDGTVEGALAPAPAVSRKPAEPEPSESTAADRAEGVPLSPYARWAPVLIMALTWALAWYVGRRAAQDVWAWWWNRTRGGLSQELYQTIAAGLAGAGLGLGTGLILRWTEGSVRARQVLLLALGWALGSAAGSWISWTVLRSPLELSLGGSLLAVVGGAVGGLITGLILRRRGSLSGWRQLIWVVGGYAVAWFLASVADQGLARAQVEGSSYWVSLLRYFAFGGLAGAIGGVVLYWQLGRLTGSAAYLPAASETRPVAQRRRFAWVAALAWGGCWAAGHVLGGILFAAVMSGVLPFPPVTVAVGLIIGAGLGAATGWLLGRLGHPLSVRQRAILAAVWAAAGGAIMILLTFDGGRALAEVIGSGQPAFVFWRKYGRVLGRGPHLAEWLLGWALAAFAAGGTAGFLRRPAARPLPWRRILIIAVGFALAWVIGLYAAELALEYFLMPLERSAGLGLSLADILVDFLTGALAGAAAGAVLHWQLAPAAADQGPPSS